MSRFVSLLALSLPLLACDPGADAPFDGAEPQTPLGKADGAADLLAEGTPEAIGVLRMLAEPSTTFEVLDDDAALDRRAAESIIAWRDGDDGVYEGGSGDDRTYTRIAEVDARRWVGPSALGKLRDHALHNDFVPGGAQHLGTWDGIDFTVDEALALVAFVNEAEPDALYDVLRDSRPHEAILEARPVASVLQVSELHWVGPAMLGRLADASAGDPGGEACQDDADCPGHLRCVGSPSDSPWGVCRDLSPVAGDGDACLADTDCETDLFCSALTIFEEGFCRPEWMRGDFTDGGVASIPAVAMPEGTALGVHVAGLASVPEDIVVTVELDHPHPESLRLWLRDPNGAEAMLWDGPQAGGAAFEPTMSAGWGISRDDQVNGDWWLVFQNVDGLGEGTLGPWTLQLSSRWD